jgi:hypothetical protein
MKYAFFTNFIRLYVPKKERTFQHVDNSVSLTGRYLFEATVYAR